VSLKKKEPRRLQGSTGAHGRLRQKASWGKPISETRLSACVNAARQEISRSQGTHWKGNEIEAAGIKTSAVGDSRYTLRVTTDNAPLFCDRCSTELVPGKGNFYVVRIEAVADPSPPNIDGDDLDKDLRRDIVELVQNMSHLSQQELLDQVYRRVTIFLCVRCYTKWIENPTG